jgi:hypothetical protein
VGTNVSKECTASNITEKAVTIWICENAKCHTDFIFSYRGEKKKMGESVNVKAAQVFSVVSAAYDLLRFP